MLFIVCQLFFLLFPAAFFSCMIFCFSGILIPAGAGHRLPRFAWTVHIMPCPGILYQEENIMTLLKCSAHNCCYNRDSRCSRGSINMDGADARYADDTACESFRSQNECSAKNSADSGCGCETVNIDCKAHSCTYNKHCKCTAASICVSGDHARECCDTKCETFECKC